MSSKAPSTPASRSGITTAADGQRHIPSSTRADGSKRKEIKIRPGYRPLEDVEVYKNRTAEAFRNRGSGGVPGAGSVNEEETPKGSTASHKNAKRREARKRAKAAGEESKDGVSGKGNEAPAAIESTEKLEEPPTGVDPEAEKDKKVKRLRKKLREAKELQAKKEKGEGLLQEQFEKVIRINELMRDLEKLGVHDDSSGNPAE